MKSNHGFICLLTGHRKTEYETTFNEIGRHVELKRCRRCGKGEEVAFTGPIFPGEADDPEEALEYISEHEDYDPEDTIWEWDEPNATKEQLDELRDGDKAL